MVTLRMNLIRLSREGATVTTEPVRLNLGSGMYPLEGWTNVDAHCDADITGDIRELDFQNVEEVRMSHLLEHIPWRDALPTLERIHGWMIPGGLFTVEVPDMDRILARGTAHPLWYKYVYGDQSHEGEYHAAGYTAQTLRSLLLRAGFGRGMIRRFESQHPGRVGMPCLEAEVRA